jgi:succinyl-diaminopimelate desuccinylase
VSTASPPELPGLDDLVEQLVNVPSVSGSEAALASLVERFLSGREHLEVVRDGDAVLARTRIGAGRRVLLAGHLDTVPLAGNVPSWRQDRRLYGCGSSDMKSGLAVMLALATAPPTGSDLTCVFYDGEEVAASRNGLGRLTRTHREWLDADLAVLLEPTDGRVEAGCQGSLRVQAALSGVRAHTARSWLGANAIHAAGPLLERLRVYRARTAVVDGCEYREGLSAVAITGGVAGNVVPDACVVTVNFRYAPDRSSEEALDHLRDVLGPDVALVLDDLSPAASPRLTDPAVAGFLAAVGTPPRAKLGWTDVARFSALGIPALNFGPGEPEVAHTPHEWVDLDRVHESRDVLAAYLASGV